MEPAAPSLETLLRQVNAMFPGRDKSSDGTLGDKAHAARTSDHNRDADGVIRALDITHDPAHGLDAGKLARALVASRDSRIRYIISNAQIFNSQPKDGQPAWAPRPYDGENAHRHHCHVSVNGPPLRDDPRDWTFLGLAPVQPKIDTTGVYRFRDITATEFGGPKDSMSGKETAYQTPGAWWDRPGVSLPAPFPRAALPMVRVRNTKNGLTVDAPVIDKGPHYDGTAARPADPYWLTGKRPRAESDPATNKAGIDLTPAAGRAIALEGKGLVDWDFVESIPVPVPQPTPTPEPTPVPEPTPTPISGAFDAIVQAVVQVLTDHIRAHPELVMEVLIVVLQSLLKAQGSPPASFASNPPSGTAPAKNEPAASPPRKG